MTPSTTYTGELDLGVALRPGPGGASHSVATHQYHRGALSVLRPHYLDDSGQAMYTVLNPGGGFLGGDSYRLGVRVAQGASLLLSSQSATKVYRSPQGPATQDMRVRLEEGAVLEYVPDQLIVYREGRYRQRALVDMHPGSSLLLTDIVTPGWAPDGSIFGWRELSLRTEVRCSGRRLAVDHLRLLPGEGVTGLGHMEGYTHAGTLMAVDARLNDEAVAQIAALVRAEEHTRSGMSRLLEAPGLPAGFVVRSLARNTGHLRDLHLAIAACLRAHLRGQGPIEMRKYQ
ncbi:MULTISPECIES: urease accessory protein UreD [unclassified Corynebacterium]|uniref:urease accessory protein UreD n=1 Tax=unclassified Corynebacterium TaxID=2624378 RepID=UPI0029C9DA32|nr:MULTISPECIES: urease accessory protein UreD [unclassified Corynebacterium]WPF66408.1 urease accessory protein UreD [Corynebacterium sp. 22KM0430]WPF68898.1 urease accessory protein UreD [Corynebacterium sp. 21KM1197]